MSSKITNRDQLYLFLEHGVELDTKTIYMGYGLDPEMDIDQGLARNVIMGLRILSSIRPEEPISIIVNCQGGDTQHGFAIYDAIRMVNSPVHITVIGHCYSMAAWILQAGDIRRISRNSSLMIHDGDSTVSGRKDETKSWYKFYEEQDVMCREILLQKIREKNPGFTMAKLEKMLKTDTILWPQQALELGLIDEVLE